MAKKNLLQHSVFKLPVYFFVGKYDHDTEPALAYQYFAALKAPKRQLFEFAHSAHAPMRPAGKNPPCSTAGSFK